MSRWKPNRLRSHLSGQGGAIHPGHGVSYVNFDNIPLWNGGGTSGGIGVTFTGTGQAVQGASSGVYAAPFLSNSNGVLFGDPTVAGPDATTYLTTGTGSVTTTPVAPRVPRLRTVMV